MGSKVSMQTRLSPCEGTPLSSDHRLVSPSQAIILRDCSNDSRVSRTAPTPAPLVAVPPNPGHPSLDAWPSLLLEGHELRALRVGSQEPESVGYGVPQCPDSGDLAGHGVGNAF